MVVDTFYDPEDKVFRRLLEKVDHARCAVACFDNADVVYSKCFVGLVFTHCRTGKYFPSSSGIFENLVSLFCLMYILYKKRYIARTWMKIQMAAMYPLRS